MKFTPGSAGRAPVVEFDPREPEAAIAMFALATWPTDPTRQRQWQAVQEAALIEKFKAPPAHLAAMDMARAQAEAMRTGRDAAAIAAEGRRLLQSRAEQRLEGVGGYGTVIDAPAREALVTSILAASRGGARRAGQVLLVLASMQEHHQDLPPSQNRAMAVVEARFAGKVDGTGERALKDAMEQHRAVVPFWAALSLHDLVLARVSLVQPGAAFLDPLHRHLVLGAAIWFREFASTFVPKRSSGPLIDASEMVEMRVGIEPTKPELPPLPPKLLKVAQSYRAKAVKQGY